MAKRHVTLAEIKTLLEAGRLLDKGGGHAWISHRFGDRADNLVCAAVLIGDAVIVKTVMVGWQLREPQ